MFLFFGRISEAVFPDILKVTPNKVYPEQRTVFLIKGDNVNNFPEDVQIDLGEGITISSIDSDSPWVFTTIKVGVVISGTASLGFRNLTLTSLQESEIKVITDAIEVVNKSIF